MKLIKVGRIVNTHGIRGELKIQTHLEELIVKGCNVLIKGENSTYEEVVETRRMHKGFLLITLKGYNNINEVLKFKGCNIFVYGSDDVILSQDIIGFKVEEHGKTIGVVSEVLTNTSQDVIVLDNNIMIPNVDEFVKDIDVANCLIKVVLIEGMLDAN